MPDTKETNSTSGENSERRNFNFCCGDSESMSRMMRKFCGRGDKTFDCGEMMQKMQKMCCAHSEKSER